MCGRRLVVRGADVQQADAEAGTLHAQNLHTGLGLQLPVVLSHAEPPQCMVLVQDGAQTLDPRQQACFPPI